MKLVIPATLAIIFLLLYFNFKSIGETLIVMLSLPFALVGGIWFIWALGYNWSVAVAIGFGGCLALQVHLRRVVDRDYAVVAHDAVRQVRVVDGEALRGGVAVDELFRVLLRVVQILGAA